MKKRTLRKLELTRETLRTLGEKAMGEVAGADTRQNSCDTVTVWACNVTDRTCGTATC